MLRFLIVTALCGWSSGSVAVPPSPDQRIIGGYYTTIAEHPHQVDILLNRAHYCGGSIIYASWVLTSAGCIQSYPSMYRVSVGSDYFNGGKKYSVKNIVVHPEYDPDNFDNNIALLEIHGAFEFNAMVQPIRLATHEPPTGVAMNVTGWGRVTESGTFSNRLKQVSIPIVDRNRCSSIYGNINVVTPRMICGGVDEGGKGTCYGDGGGPLSANGVLYGVSSWIYGCAKPGYPSVFTNVASYIPWIRFITGI